MRFTLVLIVSLLSASSSSSQSLGVGEVEWADSVLQFTREIENTEVNRKIELLDSAATIFLRNNRLCDYLEARTRTAPPLVEVGSVDSSIALLFDVQKKYKSECDSTILMMAINNMAYSYLLLEDLPKVDSVCALGLSLWNNNWEDYNPKLSFINNWSISKAYQGEMQEAEALFRRLLKESEYFESLEYEAKALVNLGTLKGMTGNLDSAYYFFQRAGEVAVRSDDLDSHVPILINLAQIESMRGSFDEAHFKLDSAQVVAEMTGDLDFVGMVLRAKSEVYENETDFKEALRLLKEYLTAREEVLDEKRIKAVSEMEEKYEAEKNARQIKELEVENLDAELRNEKVTRSRNRFIFAGVLVVLLSIALASRLNYVRRSRAAIQKEKDVSENLLLNILPEEVAKELKEKGSAEAQLMDPVTVLFTDFKGFTAMSEKLSPQELVKDLNDCFSAFDGIMGKYGIEKIKTIGDAYMAAGGLPTPTATHVQDVINAALEMRDFVEAGKNEKIKQGLPFFEIRIGIHTGPVVAGIVGVKKFQYDIWGDTVNTASRMESSGKEGMVNISEASYTVVKGNPAYSFENRGEIEAKGKGKMRMYFVSQN